MGTPRIWVHQPHREPPGPQHVAEGEEAVRIFVAYDSDPEEEPPEDVHVDFRRVGPEPFGFLGNPYPWREILDSDVDAVGGRVVGGSVEIPVLLEPVPSSGAYDVRVRWTRKWRKSGRVVGEQFIGNPRERIGQFFVD
jgi:hypothetical protein